MSFTTGGQYGDYSVTIDGVAYRVCVTARDRVIVAEGPCTPTWASPSTRCGRHAVGMAGPSHRSSRHSRRPSSRWETEGMAPPADQWPRTAASPPGHPRTRRPPMPLLRQACQHRRPPSPALSRRDEQPGQPRRRVRALQLRQGRPATGHGRDLAGVVRGHHANSRGDEGGASGGGNLRFLLARGASGDPVPLSVSPQHRPSPSEVVRLPGGSGRLQPDRAMLDEPWAAPAAGRVTVQGIATVFPGPLASRPSLRCGRWWARWGRSAIEGLMPVAPTGRRPADRWAECRERRPPCRRRRPDYRS